MFPKISGCARRKRNFPRNFLWKVQERRNFLCAELASFCKWMYQTLFKALNSFFHINSYENKFNLQNLQTISTQTIQSSDSWSIENSIEKHIDGEGGVDVLPPILVVALNRVYYCATAGTTKKYTGDFQYGSSLYINPGNLSGDLKFRKVLIDRLHTSTLAYF